LPSAAEAIVAFMLTVSGADAFEGWRLTIPDNVPADVLTLADPSDPVAQARLWEAIFPAIPRGALLDTCLLESGCRRIEPTSRYYHEGTGIHVLDLDAGERSYRGAYDRGHLQGCEFWPDPSTLAAGDPWFFNASTRGNYGLIAAFNIRKLGACVPLEALDSPFFSAWASAVKIDRICQRYEQVRKRPCSKQAVRCAWARAEWGSKNCGRVIRKMKKRLAQSQKRKRLDLDYHPTLADLRRARDARATDV
jgi:hypothetical protein